MLPIELLAPAGGAQAAYAAFHYGANAVYAGLKRFSARAEADNFTAEELAELVGYAHSLTPRRRVFVTVNTLIKDDDLAGVIAALEQIAEIGVDAVIVQDLGVYRIVHRYFPELTLHASTQMAVHNLAGALALKEMGFKRVTLARELTLDEIINITKHSGIETECFIHGALCYSYSGLCLFSAMLRGRSGNCGACQYPCRDMFTHLDEDDEPTTSQGLIFSMRDLALPDMVDKLRAAGVASLKIEGRKKSPLYVATVTDFYRRLLDRRLPTKDFSRYKEDLQTVFSRPWTELYLQSRRNQLVIDPDIVGHRGAAIGTVERLAHGEGQDRLRFRTKRALERHDGLQVDLPNQERPFGFAVDKLWQVLSSGGKARAVKAYEVKAGDIIEVELPHDHPFIPTGATVYCSSSQKVKRTFTYERPKPGLFRQRYPLAVEINWDTAQLRIRARVLQPRGRPPLEMEHCVEGPFQEAKEPEKMAQVVMECFQKLGDTPFQLGELKLNNAARRFAAVSLWNQWRRAVTETLAEKLAVSQEARVSQREKEVLEYGEHLLPARPFAAAKPSREEWRWQIKVDRIGLLDSFANSDLGAANEIIIDIGRDELSELAAKLTRLVALVGQDHIRLALPVVTRAWQEQLLTEKIEHFLQSGWRRWQVSGLAGWTYLRNSPCGDLDISCDWPMYVMNRLAIAQALDLGASSVTLSPEDSFNNMQTLLRDYGERAAVIAYQDVPLFISESCAQAQLQGKCPGPKNCNFHQMDMVSAHHEKVTVINQDCRTIVIKREPFCQAGNLGKLAEAGARLFRVDFVWREYSPDEVVRTWREALSWQ